METDYAKFLDKANKNIIQLIIDELKHRGFQVIKFKFKNNVVYTFNFLTLYIYINI